MNQARLGYEEAHRLLMGYWLQIGDMLGDYRTKLDVDYACEGYANNQVFFPIYVGRDNIHDMGRLGMNFDLDLYFYSTDRESASDADTRLFSDSWHRMLEGIRRHSPLCVDEYGGEYHARLAVYDARCPERAVAWKAGELREHGPQNGPLNLCNCTMQNAACIFNSVLAGNTPLEQHIGELVDSVSASGIVPGGSIIRKCDLLGFGLESVGSTFPFYLKNSVVLRLAQLNSALSLHLYAIEGYALPEPAIAPLNDKDDR
jgi:hypothetical protein